MKRVKSVAIVLGVVTAITMWNPNNLVKAETKSVPAGYIPIYTIEDLYGINDDLDGNYILMNDIDLSETKPGGDWDSGSGWTPIGIRPDDEYEYFMGVLDGNGYRIENMTIYGETTGWVGLFAAVGGTVKNLGLTNIDISCDKGGTDCGGLAALVHGEVDSCYVTGKIESNKSSYIGGIGADERGNGASVTNCYTDLDIIDKGSAHLVGGIIAGNYNGDISNCYAIGTIESLGESEPWYGWEVYAGAITGSDDKYDGYSNQCYYLGNQNDRFAKKLSKAQMKSQKCFTGFDFKNTWVVDKNSSYPYPQLRNCMQVRTESIELLSTPDKVNYTTFDKQLDLTGSELKICYEDDYDVTVPLDESMLSYKMKEGKQTVSIRYNNCKTSFEIDVKEGKESLKILSKKAKLKIGDSFTYKVKYVGKGKVQYVSSNSKILAINKTTGKAKAKKAGNVVITIKAGKLSKTVKVKVVK